MVRQKHENAAGPMKNTVMYDLKEVAVDEREAAGGGSALAGLWGLREDVAYLNHGSFGACPKAVLAMQTEFRRRLEASPWRYQVLEMTKLYHESLARLAAFVGADFEEVVFVPNATHGVNTVLRSLKFHPGDELLTCDHDYFACRNALAFTARRNGAEVKIAHVPFPLQNSREIIDAMLAAATERTRLVLIDHVTSPTGLIFPVEELVRAFAQRGIETLVDGAHAPGMIPLNLRALGATYYTGNCHKWICAPKGAAFLYVDKKRQADIHPLPISHVAAEVRPPVSAFHHEFFWAGTIDSSAYLCVAHALDYMERLVPGGWPEIMARNHALTVAARKLLCEALQIEPPCPEEMIGSLASVPLPDADDFPDPVPPWYVEPLQEALFQVDRIDVPVIYHPKPPHRLLRVSGQLYNHSGQYEKLARVLTAWWPR